MKQVWDAGNQPKQSVETREYKTGVVCQELFEMGMGVARKNERKRIKKLSPETEKSERGGDVVFLRSGYHRQF